MINLIFIVFVRDALTDFPLRPNGLVFEWLGRITVKVDYEDYARQVESPTELNTFDYWYEQSVFCSFWNFASNNEIFHQLQTQSSIWRHLFGCVSIDSVFDEWGKLPKRTDNIFFSFVNLKQAARSWNFNFAFVGSIEFWVDRNWWSISGDDFGSFVKIWIVFIF